MKKVLTVDDSKVVRTMVARHLQPYGCQVLEAANGREGVDVARKEQPDLILLDVTMPVMDGRQALAEIRQDAALKGTPVVMLTAESGKDLVLEIAKLGVKGYIVKPFTKATFEAEVGKLLGGGSQPAAAAQPSTPGCVLVVDDSERVLAAARASLEASVKVLTASSGADAVAQFAAERPRVAATAPTSRTRRRAIKLSAKMYRGNSSLGPNCRKGRFMEGCAHQYSPGDRQAWSSVP